MKIIYNLFLLSRYQKRAISSLIDVIALVLIAYLAIALRYGSFDFDTLRFLPAIIIFPLLALPVFIKQGLYRAFIRYIGHRFAFTIFISASLSVLLWSTTLYMLELPYPRSAIINTWLIVLLYISASRVLSRWILAEYIDRHGVEQKQVVIFGAGFAGQQLLSALNKIPSIRVVCFIDDDSNLYRSEIASTKVFPRHKFESLVKKHSVSDLFLAVPSTSHEKRKRILEWAAPYPVKVSTLPGIDEIVAGKVSFNDIREVDIEDLLGRDTVPPKQELLTQCISGQSVMITGAGGSIGSELCRKALKQQPKTLILLERSEFALYTIERELKALPELSNTNLVAVLGSVLDQQKLSDIISIYNVNTIYHAAAYKHVPIVEHNIKEGIVNNTFGTHSAALVAAKLGVENFVLISTDKAVRPTNVMGASKRLAEMSLQALQKDYPSTRFVMVRFGNVLGSSGSVIPLFRKQIASGGPVTVTHKEITRFFMTIPEAASLVIQAGSMGVGGDVFVLDMGEPVKIDELARKVITLSGLEVMNKSGSGDIEIVYTGLRPGEKLFEELLIGEHINGTEHPRIMKAHEEFLDYTTLLKQFTLIEKALSQHNYQQVLLLLTNTVAGFDHTSGVVDYLQNKQQSSISH